MFRNRLTGSVFVAFLGAASLWNGTDAVASVASVNVAETHQTMEGFGASIAWWYGELFSHPKKEEIYSLIFSDLGVDILRLRNIYGKSTRFDIFEEIVNKMYFYSDNTPSILLTSWTPPVDLKSNNNLNNGGTLKKENGQYVYGKFAKYWIDALNAYNAVGIQPTYISIQNEPSYVATTEETAPITIPIPSFQTCPPLQTVSRTNPFCKRNTITATGSTRQG
jgi:O-glycosyl hydrolase